MRITLVLRTVNKETLANLKKVMEGVLGEAPQYLLKVKEEQRKIVFDKIKHLNKWYTKFIGLDEVQVYQERVTALQDKLLETQTKRRELSTKLTEVRHQANEVQSQIQHVDRKEKFDVYCQLINDERMILNMERSFAVTFQEYDQAERDLFTAFTNAVRDSQEKQRAQLEYSKYIGLALSLIGSFLAFVYTFFWKQDLKLYMQQQIASISIPTYPDSILINKADLKNILNVVEDYKRIQKNINPNQIQQQNIKQALDRAEELEETVIKVCKYIGIGLLGIICLRAIFG